MAANSTAFQLETPKSSISDPALDRSDPVFEDGFHCSPCSGLIVWTEISCGGAWCESPVPPSDRERKRESGLENFVGSTNGGGHGLRGGLFWQRGRI